MSLAFASVTCLLAIGQSQSARVSFDLLTYEPPAGFTETKTEQIRSYVIGAEDSDYSQVIVYKSVAASNDALKNFEISWEALVKETLGAKDKPKVSGPIEAGRTKVVAGVGSFALGSKTFAAILTNYTRGEITQNVLVITNTEKHTAQLNKFADSIKLTADSPGTSVAASPGSPIGKNTVHVKDARVPTVYMRVFRGTIAYKNFQWLAIYPNGDCLPFLPDTGFLGFDKPLSAESWGKWSRTGKQVQITSKYFDQKLDVLSETEWRVVNSEVLKYYKLAPVNGLRLEGNYSADGLGWKRDQADVISRQPTYIAFRTDGTFTDYGCYHNSARETPKAGKYEIKNFSLVLRYADGAEVQRSFCGIGSEDPQKSRGAYAIGGFSWFREGG